MTIFEASPQYTPILAPKDVVTGVRGYTGTDVILTGSTVTPDGKVTAMIYLGQIPSTANGKVFALEPAIQNRKVTTSTFYGPDTYVDNKRLPDHTIRAVGTFQCEGGEGRNHGMLYQGKPEGGGGWNELNMPDDLAGGKVWNTIPHSTMGDLMVGNYDLDGVPGSAGAFVYDIVLGKWSKLELEGCTLTSAYGIWQNGIASNSYTIVGGTYDETGINQGFVADYDLYSGKTSNLTLYANPENPQFTHFEGITEAVGGGFNLAGQADAEFALFTHVERVEGGFSDGPWSVWHYPDSDKTSGNTVYQNILMGIFTEKDSPVQSYAVTFPPEQDARGRLRARVRDAMANRPRILAG